MSRHKQQDHRIPGTDWAYKYNFINDLPEVPFDPKLLEYPFPADRIYRYERIPLLDSAPLAISGRDFENGVPVAPFGRGHLLRALQDPNVPLTLQELDDADKFLVGEELVKEEKKEAPATIKASWLRKSGPEFLGTPRRTSSFRAEAPAVQEEEEDTSLEAQLRAILKTFEDALETDLTKLKHPQRPNLKATEIIPVLPNFDLEGELYVLLSYDGDPLEKKARQPGDVDQSRLKQERAEAVLKPLANPYRSDESFLAYYTPTDETLERMEGKKRKQDDAGDLFGEEESDEEKEGGEEKLEEHTFVRDYNWEPDNRYDKREVFMELREGEGAYYQHYVRHFSMKRKRLEADESYVNRPLRLTLGKRSLDLEEEQEREQQKWAGEYGDVEDADGEAELDASQEHTSPKDGGGATSP
ncbi:RNA polymerase-associated factor [Rhizophlyctis rosea]|nr:RNA polymerase-associated factor [Rhizophlyctis rosea]